MSHKGMLVVFSAPSGCGKDTVFKELCKRRDDIIKSVSATTRKPRRGEINGKNYFFVSEEEFKHMIDNDGLLEYAKYNNCYYGTPVKGVKRAIDEGKICFLIIEVQGAQKVMKIFPDCVSIFLLPPSEKVLEKRLYGRHTDSDDMIRNRLDIAKIELAFKDKYTYKIVNDDLDSCVDDIEKILCDELEKRNA
ncbi:MAG: guanylate kinase [Eubacterium sp.]